MYVSLILCNIMQYNKEREEFIESYYRNPSEYAF